MNQANATVETMQNHIDYLTKTQNDLKTQINEVLKHQTNLSNEFDQINVRRVDIEVKYDKNVEQLDKMEVQFESVIDSIASYNTKLIALKNEATKAAKKDEFDVCVGDRFDSYTLVPMNAGSNGVISIVAMSNGFSRWNDITEVACKLHSQNIWLKSSELYEKNVVPGESQHTKVNR
jgi:hypothetical protein